MTTLDTVADGVGGYRNPLADGSLDSRIHQRLYDGPMATPPGYDTYEYDYDVSGPAVFDVIQDALSTDRIRSHKLRALDQEIRSQMGMKMDDSLILDANCSKQDFQGYPHDESGAEERRRERSEERMYAKLVAENETRGRAGGGGEAGASSNPGRTPKSLFDELEDKENFDRAKVHCGQRTKQLSAVVQQPNERNANSVVLDPKRTDRMSRHAIDALFPPQTFIDDNIGMTVTLNAYEDPEELILSDAEDEEFCYSEAKPSASSFKRIQELIGRRFAATPAYQTPVLQHQPPQRVCCSIM